MTIRGARRAALTASTLALLVAGASTFAGATASAFTPTARGFGFKTFAVTLSKTQAGSHPNLTVAFEFNNVALALTGGEVRNLAVDLPPGLVGDPTAVHQCTRQQLDEEQCPADSQVGVDLPDFGGVGSNISALEGIPVYNMAPPSGVPAQFAFDLLKVEEFIDSGVRSGTDNGITSHVDNIVQRNIVSNTVTFFGEVDGKPFLIAPTSCGKPLKVSVRASTWQEPNETAMAETGLPAITGCRRLAHFEPSLSAAPDTSFADTPAGLTTAIELPQEVNPEGLATSGLQDTTVTLPEGVVINPGQAAGLQACQPAQEGLGVEPNGGSKEGPPECPSGSKVGTVEIETPLLKSTLKGDVYVLQSNPPHLQLLVAASGEGVNIKLVGNVGLDESTGRLTTTFQNTPDLPFTDFRLAFSGGAQAALATPTRCGVYETTSDFTPWASPLVSDSFPDSAFQITAGPGGSACSSSPLPFSPELIAGATTDQAGGFTNFSLLLRRGDGQQRIERLQFKAPLGMSGMLSAVPLCPEPQAQAGTCSAASQIGHAAVTSGPGPYPLVIPQPGNPESSIYLTGPYDGAPFGLSIVTHVIAGPFDLEKGTLCDCIVTRAKIEVDPLTARITVTTEPLPQIVAGVPTDLRLIDAVVDRPGFMVNPTNCEPSSFSGAAWGAPPPGLSEPHEQAPISTRFQVGACRSLEFKPKFAVTASGGNSKADGASLRAEVGYPSAPQGSEANIAKFKVELPEQLPSRLTTLQKACTSAQFEADPAACPAASRIGHATVRTPLLPVPLEGPAIFVSHGSEAFPSLTLVLQGDGVTIELVGSTFISKAGITSTTFKAVPDAPFSSFELVLPQGPYSALAANGDLCAPTKTVTVKQKVEVDVHGHTRTVTHQVRKAESTSLAMPTEIVAQNGAEIHESTAIAVAGCPKAARRNKRGKSRRNKRGK